MKHIFILSAMFMAFSLTASGASAACYADYKAKRDQPLKLHYGVVKLKGDCKRSAAKQEIAKRLESRGWILLNVLSVFDEDGLAERKQSAGKFYLRF